MVTTAYQPQGMPSPAHKFGTLLGVFTPSLLTILGVMMYLRFGWVLGNLGLPLTLLTVLLASSITFVTGLSASAIATNMHIGVGGEYYMVSRSLGLEFGGAIGIPLFLCRTLSLTLYAFGLAESISFIWPVAWGNPPIPWMAMTFIIFITAISGKSAALSLRLQIPIMVAVGLSLAALSIGVFSGEFTEPELTPHYERSATEGFWYVFAVFFPAVTGFTAGIGMSGDLKDPKRAIPLGTILAIVTGTVVYLSIPLLLSITGKVNGEELALLDPQSPPVWTKIAFLGFWFIYPGMWGAILSSAFGSALGGPRVLQALASDGLAPSFLSRTSRTGQPTVATWVTGLIAVIAVGLGDLNAVGRWVTIFFLTLYVTINLAAAVETLVGDPSYRPTIRIPWFISFAGSSAAAAVMFLISPAVCLSAVLLETCLYLYLRQKALKSSWGDVRVGLWTTIARFAMLKLQKLTPQARNWRPNILLFTTNPANRIGLVRMANWFNQNRGVVTVCRLVEGHLGYEKYDVRGMLHDMDTTLNADGLLAFSEIDIVPEFESGIIGVAQANGFAGLKSNTVMFGWPNDTRGIERLLRIFRVIAQIQMSTILARLSDLEGPIAHNTIDIWWRGLQKNGDLMLLLAHLLNLNPEWRKADICLRTIVDTEKQRRPMQEKLAELIADVRIPATTDVIVNDQEMDVIDMIHRASLDTDVVFLGLNIPNPGEEPEYAVRLDRLVSGFKTAILVRNAEPFAGEMV
jgi:amino acid transporter